MNEVLQQLYARKSVRVYTDQPISVQDKKAILNAAMQAPTAGNMMLYSILDITDQTIKDKLAVTCDNQPFIAKAPMVLVFLADYQRWFDSFDLVKDSAIQEPLRRPGEGDFLLACCDALIAAQNTVVAAESLGIGSCYIGDILEQYETHRALFNLPKYVMPVGMLCYGYPAQSQIDRIKPTRFPMEDIVFENTYHRHSPDELRTMFTTQSGKPDSYNMEQSVGAMLKRKWNCDFSTEMTRSVKEMLRIWNSDN